jgi:acetyl esterase/lipase
MSFVDPTRHQRSRRPLHRLCRGSSVLFVAVALVTGLGLSASAALTPTLWQAVIYSQPAGVPLGADLWGPGPYQSGRKYVAVVVVHGGAFIRNDRSKTTSLARSLAASGFLAMNIDYRLAPQWAYPAPEQDAQAAVAWLRARPFVSSVAMFGLSSGAIITDWVAARGVVDRAVAWSGAGSYDPALIGTYAATTAILPHLGCSFADCPQLWASAAPLASVSPGDPPLLQVHSTSDPVSAVASARAMADAYLVAGAPVTYDERPGDIHSDFWGDQVVRQETIDFLRG